MRTLHVTVLLLAATAAAVLSALWWPAQTTAPRPPVGELNHLVHELADAWGSGSEAPANVSEATQPDARIVADAVDAALRGDAGTASIMPLPSGTQVTVVDADGAVLHATGPPIVTAQDVLAARALALPITAQDGTVLGTVHATDPGAAAAAREAIIRSRLAATLGVLVILAIAVVTVLVLDRRVLAPFRRLQGFAQDVASGHLDAPLDMDHGNVFGAWTESFDLMRTELAAARAAEEQAREDTRTILAQLSHDVRTPVASIAATVELLQLGTHDATTRDRLDVVARKAAQMDALVTDLFVANRDQLSALPVQPETVPAAQLAQMVDLAVVDAPSRAEEPPALLVQIDPRRMQQVIDNVISNAHKHARSGVEVSFERQGDLLRMSLADTGPGVPEDELGLILGRGVRGSAAEQVPGSGLGLFTAAHLMERMGGALAVRNRPGGGLVVDLDVPLA